MEMLKFHEIWRIPWNFKNSMILWKNVKFLEFCVFEQIWLPECQLFTCKTKLFCVLGDAGVDFMEFYGNSWNFIKLKKKWKCSFCKISMNFTKMRRGLKTTTKCNAFLVVLRQRSVKRYFTTQNAKFSSFCYFFMKWAHFS